NTTAGNTTFGGAVGGTTAVSSLKTNADGTTRINGGVVTTSGDQTYNDKVTLGADATLTAANVVFGNTVNSSGAGVDLTVNAKTAINGGVVTTSGDQTYNDAVTLGADATLTAANVIFANTVSSSGAGVDLTVNAKTAINGGAVTTSGDQTYLDDVKLGADATLTGANVSFNGLLDSAATTH